VHYALLLVMLRVCDLVGGCGANPHPQQTSIAPNGLHTHWVAIVMHRGQLIRVVWGWSDGLVDSCGASSDFCASRTVCCSSNCWCPPMLQNLYSSAVLPLQANNSRGALVVHIILLCMSLPTCLDMFTTCCALQVPKYLQPS
jgi:hypothetical protein